MADGILTPAQLNRLWAKKMYSGTLGIFTIVSGWYQWYLPMFVDRIKKELPNATPLVYVRGEVEIPEPWASMCKRVKELDQYSDCIFEGYTTSALRFVYSDTEIESFDYVLITDADMLLMVEDPDIINQHMRHLGKYGLGCYSNYISAWVESRPRCPGVHFVTKRWWEKTASIRSQYSDQLKSFGSPSWEYDEIMLGSIIRKSGLDMTSDPILWTNHGIHLGDWRRRIIKGTNDFKGWIQPCADQQLYMKKLLADTDFMAIVDLCSPHIFSDTLKDTFKLFREV